MADETPPSLAERFPALGRLGQLVRRRRVPYVHQLSETECGAACLAMVLGYQGKDVPLDEVREITGVSRDGASALAIVDAGRWYGLRGRGVKIEMDDLDYLQPATVLHWEFRHFVIFERLLPDAVDIVDPAAGRRRIPLDQFARSFTGIALEFEPSETFEVQRKDERPIIRHLRKLLVETGRLSRVLAVSGMLQVLALGLPALTGVLVDRVVPRGDSRLLSLLCVAMGSVVVFQLLGQLVRSHLLLHLRVELDAKKMTLGFLEHLVDLPYGFFQKRSTGDLLNRAQSNIQIRELLTAGAISGVIDGWLVVAYLAVLLIACPTLGLLTLGLGLFQISIYAAARRPQRELMTESLEAESKANSFQFEMVSGIETLKAMGSEYRALDRWSNLFVDTLNVQLRRGQLNAMADSFINALKAASPIVILCFGAYQVLNGALSLGTMLALNALAIGFLMPLSSLVTTFLQFQVLRSYLERINDVLDGEAEQMPGAQLSPPLRGHLTFEKVAFRYAPNAPMSFKTYRWRSGPGRSSRWWAARARARARSRT